MPTLRALLIGIDCYLPNQLPDGSYYPNLGGCVNDVRRVQGLLRERFGVKDEDVTLLTASGTGKRPSEPEAQWPTYANIVAAMKRLCEVSQPGDSVVVHYSGHGGRVRTLFPKIKGPDGLDEGLVPTDVGSGTHVRDIELSYLIKAMVKKGLVVTAVLDCCHSGGMQRAFGGAVRGIGVPDLREMPAASDAAPLEELEAEAAEGAGARDISAASGWLRQTTGYVLIAACRAAELANETAFDGGTSGALTYAWCQELRALRPGVTYDVVADRMVAAVHSRYPRQTPCIEGERDRLVFGADRIAPPAAINVLGVDASRDRIRIQAGVSSGLSAGAKLAVYPNGTLDPDDDNRLAIAEVTDIGSVESWAEVKRHMREEPIRPGDQAVWIQGAGAHVRRAVRLLAPEARSAALAAEIKRSGGGFLRVVGGVEGVEGAEAADFQVAVDRDGFDEIQDGAGIALDFILPKTSAEEDGAGAKLVERLVHLAKYRNVQALQNGDEQSRLSHKLSIKILGWQADYDESDAPRGMRPQPFADPASPAVPHGAWLFLSLKNELSPNPKDPDDLSRILNVALLSLGPRWQIEQAWPANEDFRAMQPGAEEVVALRTTVPEGAARCVDILKAMATSGTTSFSWLLLPSLDERAEQRAFGGPAGELEKLFASMTDEGAASRVVEGAASAPDGWTSAQVEITTERG